MNLDEQKFHPVIHERTARLKRLCRVDAPILIEPWSARSSCWRAIRTAPGAQAWLFFERRSAMRGGGGQPSLP